MYLSIYNALIPTALAPEKIDNNNNNNNNNNKNNNNNNNNNKNNNNDYHLSTWKKREHINI